MLFEIGIWPCKKTRTYVRWDSCTGIFSEFPNMVHMARWVQWDTRRQGITRTLLILLLITAKFCAERVSHLPKTVVKDWGAMPAWPSRPPFIDWDFLAVDQESIDVDAQKERCTGCYVVTGEDCHGASATLVSSNINVGDTSRSTQPCANEKSFSNKTLFPNFPLLFKNSILWIK